MRLGRRGKTRRRAHATKVPRGSQDRKASRPQSRRPRRRRRRTVPELLPAPSAGEDALGRERSRLARRIREGLEAKRRKALATKAARKPVLPGTVPVRPRSAAKTACRRASQPTALPRRDQAMALALRDRTTSPGHPAARRTNLVKLGRRGKTRRRAHATKVPRGEPRPQGEPPAVAPAETAPSEDGPRDAARSERGRGCRAGRESRLARRIKRGPGGNKKVGPGGKGGLPPGSQPDHRLHCLATDRRANQAVMARRAQAAGRLKVRAVMTQRSGREGPSGFQTRTAWC